MNSATIEATLRDIGSAPVSPPDLDALESRVLAAIVLPSRPVARSRRLGPVLIGAVAACLLVLVVLAAGWFGPGRDPYVLAAADDVEVVLPSGDVVAGTVGLELPVGATLAVGGSMEIDGTVYGPGDYLITHEGPVVLGGSDGGGTPVPAGGDGDGGNPMLVESTTTTPARPDPTTPADAPPAPATTVATTTTATPDPVGVRPTTTPPSTDIADRPTVVDTKPVDPPTDVTTPTERPGTTAPDDRPSRTTTTAPRERPTTTVPPDRPTTSAPRDRPATTRPLPTTTTTAPPVAPASDRGWGRP